MTSTETSLASDSAQADPGLGEGGSCARGAGSPGSGRAAWRLEILEELVEIGMGAARQLRDQMGQEAEARIEARQLGSPAPAEAAGFDYGMAFERVSRALRRTLALHDKFETELNARNERTAAEAAAQQATAAKTASPVEDRDRSQRRHKVIRAVERAIDDEADELEGSDLWDEMQERLDDYERFEDFDNDPVGKIVMHICRDLKLTPDLSLWDDEPWALEEAELKPPGSPFAPKPRRSAKKSGTAGAPGRNGHDPP